MKRFLCGVLLLVGSVGCNDTDAPYKIVEANQDYSSVLDSSVGLGAAELATEIRPLDGKDVPYAYSEWDFWIYRNRVATTAGLPNGTILVTEVDPDGYMVPILDYERAHEDSLKAGRSAEFEAAPRKVVAAAGKMDLELASNYSRAYWNLKASYFPKVPTWLAANPPANTILLPGERIATFGLLGTASDWRDQSGKELTDCLYDLEGNLLVEAPYRLGLLVEDSAAIVSEAYSRGWDGVFGGGQSLRWGYIVFRDRAGKFLFAYDYEGRRYDSEDKLKPRDEHRYIGLNPDQLQKIVEHRGAL